MDTDSFIFIVYTNDFYKDISDDVIEWFDMIIVKKMIDYLQD